MNKKTKKEQKNKIKKLENRLKNNKYNKKAKGSFRNQMKIVCVR